MNSLCPPEIHVLKCTCYMIPLLCSRKDEYLICSDRKQAIGHLCWGGSDSGA